MAAIRTHREEEGNEERRREEWEEKSRVVSAYLVWSGLGEGHGLSEVPFELEDCPPLNFLALRCRFHSPEHKMGTRCRVTGCGFHRIQ